MTNFDGLDDGFSDKPLLPEESLDDDEAGEDPDEGYSRLSHEVPEPGDEFPGDGIDGIQGADGELAGGQVGDLRAGRLVLGDAEAVVHIILDDKER